MNKIIFRYLLLALLFSIMAWLAYQGIKDQAKHASYVFWSAQ